MQSLKLESVLKVFYDLRADCVAESGILAEAQVQRVDAVKEQVQELFTRERGTEIWRARPLSALLMDYSALDVQFLLALDILRSIPQIMTRIPYNLGLFLT